MTTDILNAGVRVIHRLPNAVSMVDRRVARFVDLDEYMAIYPSAIERSFFSFFSDDDDDEDYELNGSVAVVSIDGPLMQRGGWFYDGYEAIGDRFESALSDKAVTAVVLKINSPGGVCSGCFSNARSMREMKAEYSKPVFAYADESAYSAAFAMACVADQIYLPPEGGVGSVGVIGVLEDWTAYNAEQGIKVAVITSGKYKADGNPDVALTQAVIDRYQARIDMLGRSFAELVGAARGMIPDAVLGLEAACFYGQDAVNAGLANGVSTLEDVIAKAQASAQPTMRSSTLQIRRHG